MRNEIKRKIERNVTCKRSLALSIMSNTTSSIRKNVTFHGNVIGLRTHIHTTTIQQPHRYTQRHIQQRHISQKQHNTHTTTIHTTHFIKMLRCNHLNAIYDINAFNQQFLQDFTIRDYNYFL